MGNSLNTDHEGNDPDAMIDDNALIAAMPYTWCFGADGNIRQPANIAHIWRAARAAAAGAAPADVQPSPADAQPSAAAVALLVTGDGSVDCQENPNEQEAVTAALHFCDFGGRVLLKMFTLYEHSSLCIMYLAGALIEEVHVVKPCSSKPGNSEAYLVGVGYKGCPEPLLAALLRRCGPAAFDNAALLPLELLPQPFLA
ncbi:hypothetical protein COO60DRAFT_1634432 [Scenedesmus sp. NREL 46B-D3]|nr:hypothetical protein COO60DRAFT_1634432 [Scenedesmus sp. NREL 46B-D3]